MPLFRWALNPYGLLGFGVASVFSVVQTWSLTEFCWSTWLAGLLYSWGCIAAAVLQLILTARAKQPRYAEYLPLLKNISPTVFSARHDRAEYHDRYYCFPTLCNYFWSVRHLPLRICRDGASGNVRQKWFH